MTDNINVVNGTVARIVTDDELIINKGSADGVREDMIFEILDARTRNIIDPATGEDLGSMDRSKARVRITQVEDRISLARVFPERLNSFISEAARVMSGVPRTSRLTSDVWPEGVERGDPARSTGYVYSPRKSQATSDEE